jgi:hypothetical protein
MFIAVLWWLAQVGGVGLIAYVLLWLIDRLGVPEPFNKVAKAGIAIGAAVFLIWMVLQLFMLLGHPLGG